MDVGALWAAAEMTSKVCNVIQYLRDEPTYTREDAAMDLERLLDDHVEPLLVTAFTKECKFGENDRAAIQHERRLRQLEELSSESNE